MITKVFWHVEGRVLGICNAGGFEFAQPRQMMQIARAIIQRAGQPPMVHVINHMLLMQEGQQLPPMKYQKVVENMADARNFDLLGYMVIVSTNTPPLLRFFGSATAQVAGIRMHNANTLEQAIALLRDRDETLHDVRFIYSHEPEALELRAMLPDATLHTP